MSLEDLTTKIREKMGADSGLAARLKFDLGDDGVILLDGTSSPNTVTNDDEDADCTVGVTLDDLTAMIAGELNPMTAFGLGKLRIEGDMGVAMKLGSLVG
ncbi:SCP2 sterol-binding domain-containing protein [Paraliomyxa miuraensis]|uniref:SCP2 sterol-binding domain-containing protein n=1 Tax=Paraliomyxa miuraensis TaxID=376150 RepID=UPI00225AD68A|nr:SCP2 sterol-binding domain-containing protein [Paraliomyxa miuraensis]MCX4242181.1 SCP2 sterol-binding domain-containing protein [Paraliomyxa miuraensis]